MAFIDLVEYGDNPQRAVHGQGPEADLLKAGLARDADPETRKEKLEEDLRLGVPNGAHYLGVDDYADLVGTASPEQLQAEHAQVVKLRSTAPPQAGYVAIHGFNGGRSI